MRIVHVIAGIQETCGVSQFVVNIAREQQNAGHDVTIITTMTCGFPVDGLKVVLTKDPVGWLKRRKEVEKRGGQRNEKTVLHLHTLWSRYCLSVMRWARRNGVPSVVSPHGVLLPNVIRVKYWKKWVCLRLFAREMRAISGFHVTAESEIASVERIFGRARPIVLAPLGAELAPDVLGCAHEQSKYRDVVFVGRIHPVKNLDGLIRAVACLKKGSTIHCPPLSSTCSLRLIIAGSDDVGWQKELVELAKSLGLTVVDFSQDLEFGKKQIYGGGEVPVETFQKRLAECDADVVFTGPVYAAAKDWMYRHAWVSVLPSHSENFGGVVVESLAQGTPVVASKGTPWGELEDCHCGCWVESAPNVLGAALSKMLLMNEIEREEFARAARKLVCQRYSWAASAAKVLDLYRKVLT